MAKIGDYWSEEQTTEIVNLLKEFQDIFSQYYKDLKGLVHEMGEMKIDTKLDVRPMKKRPYKLAHKYKEMVKKEIDNMLAAGIIYPIDQSEWAFVDKKATQAAEKIKHSTIFAYAKAPHMASFGGTKETAVKFIISRYHNGWFYFD